MKIAVAKGDGIGPEIMEAVLKILMQIMSNLNMNMWIWANGFLIKGFQMA
jgi:isocitrate/isopropylmalate dehydrogenase